MIPGERFVAPGNNLRTNTLVLHLSEIAVVIACFIFTGSPNEGKVGWIHTSGGEGSITPDTRTRSLFVGPITPKSL